MDTLSFSEVTRSSSTTSALEPLHFIHGAREIIEGSTSCASYSMREECIQDNTCSDALNSGVEDDNTYDYPVTDRNVSGEYKHSEDNGFSSNTANANTMEDEMNDVKVCDICGDVGYEEMLVICSECNEGAEHIYCMQTLLCNIPEGDWFCDDCKLKFNEKDQSKVITDSPLSSLSEEAEENNASKVLSSAELNLTSKKMQMQKNTGNSEECSNQQSNDSNKASADKKNTNKRQIDDNNKASENKKQATGIDNVQINASQLLSKGNGPCKVLETTRADGCGGLLQIKIPANPHLTREASLKMSGADKSDSKNSTPRSLSRESSLKIAETGKVKFLPMHTVATLCSGMTARESSKVTVIDGNSNLAPSKIGLIDPRQTSSRIGSVTVMDSAVPLVNRSGHQSSLRTGLSKSDDVFPSFLLSSRSNTPRRHSNLKSSKEAIHGDGQLGLAGKMSAKMGNSRSSSSRSCVPTSFNHSKDNNVNDDVKGMSKCSFGALTVSIVKNSNIDTSALHIRNLGSLKPDELELAKENSHLISPSAEKCSAVPTQVLQPQESMSEEEKEHTMAKKSSEELILSNRVVKDLASTEHSNVLYSVTQDPAEMKPVEEIINLVECTHEKNGKRLSASVLAESVGVSTHPAVSPLMDVSHFVKDRLPEADDLLLIKGMEMLKSRKDDCTHPHAASADGNVTVTVGNDIKLLVSNKQVVPSILDKQNREEVVPKTSVKISMDKDMVRKSSSTLDDNKSDVSLRTTQNISCEIFLGSNGGEMEMKAALKLPFRENLNSNIPNSTEANAQPTKESSKGLFSLGRDPEKHLSATSIPCRFGREVFESQNDKSILPPSEINVSSSASVQYQVNNSSSEKYSMEMPLQGMFGFTKQNLPTRPESWFLWRGGFEIINKRGEHLICDGMQAHLSNKSSLRVYEESRKFPSQLLMEQVQCNDVWPKRFEESPPTDEDIALYIFPVEKESCKIQYFELLETTIQQDLALKVNLECAELLIFASNQLPERYHRYNGWMYLWGVFRGRKKITAADSQQQFPNCNNVGNDVQPSPKHLLMKNNNPLPIQLTYANASGCSEGEEDMDVDMEGGREIGLAERPATKSETQVAYAMEDDATNISVTANSKHVSSHYENLKSGSCMPFEQDGVSLVASCSNSAKFVGTITEMKESNFVDIEGKKGLGKTESSNPRPDSLLANIMERSVAHRSASSNSKPKWSHHDNPKSGGIISFEQSRNSSFASRHSSAQVLGNIPEYMPSNVHVKEAERRNEQPRSCNANDVLEFPPGFELPPGCHNSSAIYRSNCGKHNEAMLDNVNSFGIHANLEGGELPPGFEAFSDNTKSSVNYLASGFYSQYCSHPPAAVLSEEFPPGCDPASLKASISSPDYPPGLEPAFVKPLVSFSDCSCGLETAHTKSLFPFPVWHPSLEPTYIKPRDFPAECPPGLEATLVKPLVTFPGCPPCHEHTSRKPLVSSPDFPPGLEPVFIKPGLFSPDHPPGLEITSVKSVVSSAECPPGLESVSVKPTVTLQVCPSGLVPSVQNPSFPSHNSYVTEPAEGTPNLSASECSPGIKAGLWKCPLTSLGHPPGFDSVSGKSFTLSSGHPMEHLACKKLQDKCDLEVENTVEAIHERSAKLLIGKDESSRDRTKIYHAGGRKGVTHTDSVSPVTREANKDTNLANIYKYRSFREESYYGRRRERNDRRRDKSRSRENEYDWKRSGNSHREERTMERHRNYNRENECKEACTRERHRNYNREREGRKERYRNYSREKESRKEHGRRNRSEEQGTRHGGRKIAERESTRSRDTGYYRHRSSYAGSRRHKGYDKHSHSLYDCSHPESTMRSYSAMGGKCIVAATEKTTSSYHSKSSFSDYNIEYKNRKSLSLETVSASKEDAATVNLDSKEATTDIDSVSEYCPLKSEEKLQNVEVTKNLTDEHHNQKSLSLEIVSANREDASTVNLDRREAIANIDSVQLPRSEYCQLEAEEIFRNTEASRDLADEHHNKKSLSLETASPNKEDVATFNLDRRDTITDIDSVKLPRSEYCLLEAEEKFQNLEASRVLTDEYHNHKSLSSETVSANRDDAATVNLDNREAITEIVSDYCLVESEEKFQNSEASRKLTDHHFLICDLNDDAASEHEISDLENISGEAVQVPTHANILDIMISKTEYAISHSGKIKQHVIPIQRNWSSGSRATMHDSVQCLPLFPVKENCGKAEISVSDWNFNLELGLGQRTKTTEPLPQLEQSSLQNLSCNFIFDENFGSSRSRSVFDDSRELNSAETSILSLAMPQYRRQGNNWIEVTEDTELSEEVDADLKLTL